jgi:hypothetical protein
MLRPRALCEGRELNGSHHGRHKGYIGGIAAHPFGCAQGRLLQRTQGWGTLSYGDAGEHRSEGGPSTCQLDNDAILNHFAASRLGTPFSPAPCGRLGSLLGFLNGMIANPEFQNQPKMFWAYIRTLSQHLGSTVRGEGQIKIPTLAEMCTGLGELGLDPRKIAAGEEKPTDLGAELHKYFGYRAEVLNGFVESQLMNAEQAQALYDELRKKSKYECPTPMNKQKGEKAKPAYFTGIVNTLIASSTKGAECNYSPMKLTTVTRDGAAVRTLSRRIDGAFPGVVNPVALWEIKEYYYTTTFGSRIADGVYETLVDGMELEELREREGIDIKHYLMVDAHETWWELGGRPYLCRMVDMLHMRYVDEILFGKEVVDRLPILAQEWMRLVAERG